MTNFIDAETHFIKAIQLCYPEPDFRTVQSSPQVFAFDFGPCRGDISLVIRELEKVPESDRVDPRITRMLSLLTIQRDRPQEFEVAQEAQFRECMAPIEAKRKELANKVPCPGTVRNGKCEIRMCGMVYEECAPFATAEQSRKWVASLRKDN